MTGYTFKTYISEGREHFLFGEQENSGYTEIKKDFPFPESLLDILYLDTQELRPLFRRFGEDLREYRSTFDKTYLDDVRATLSVYDLTAPEDDNDVFDYIAADPFVGSSKDIVYRRIRMEFFRELFNTLLRKDRDILSKCYDVFGCRKESLRDIAMYHMMKEDAVEKAWKRALQRLRDSYPGSRMQLWSVARRMVEQAAAEDGSCPLPGPAWWE